MQQTKITYIDQVFLYYVTPCVGVSVLMFACFCRGVGCIFYEMSTGRPLFPGSTVEEELHFIFKLLGTTLSHSLLLLHPVQSGSRSDSSCLRDIYRPPCVFS